MACVICDSGAGCGTLPCGNHNAHDLCAEQCPICTTLERAINADGYGESAAVRIVDRFIPASAKGRRYIDRKVERAREVGTTPAQGAAAGFRTRAPDPGWASTWGEDASDLMEHVNRGGSDEARAREEAEIPPIFAAILSAVEGDPHKPLSRGDKADILKEQLIERANADLASHALNARRLLKSGMSVRELLTTGLSPEVMFRQEVTLKYVEANGLLVPEFLRAFAPTFPVFARLARGTTEADRIVFREMLKRHAAGERESTGDFDPVLGPKSLASVYKVTFRSFDLLGVPPEDLLLLGYSAKQLKEIKVTAKILVALEFRAADFEAFGFTEKQWKSLGLTEEIMAAIDFHP